VKDFEGKTAFVTGGASGIGLGIAKALSARGCRVILADIDTEALEITASTFPGEVETVALDVRDRDQWAAAREQVEARFGPVSILVNNAGIMNEGSANYKEYSLISQTPESFDRMIGINLVGVYNGIHTFGPGMAERGDGHIVNTSSSQGVVSCGGVGAYCAAKFGVVGMSEALRQELADLGVGVSVLCPGVVETNLPNSTNKLVGRPSDQCSGAHRRCRPERRNPGSGARHQLRRHHPLRRGDPRPYGGRLRSRADRVQLRLFPDAGGTPCSRAQGGTARRCRRSAPTAPSPIRCPNTG